MPWPFMLNRGEPFIVLALPARHRRRAGVRRDEKNVRRWIHEIKRAA